MRKQVRFETMPGKQEDSTLNRQFEDFAGVYFKLATTVVKVVRRAVESRLGKFTKTDIMELCPTFGKTSVESSLKQLVDKGVLVKHGKGRATFYTRA